MAHNKNAGAKVAATRLRRRPNLSLADIEELIAHPQIRMADKRLRQAFESVTGWKMNSPNGFPEHKLALVVKYEDALGQLKEAYIAATRDWLLNRFCPLCGTRPERGRSGAQRKTPGIFR
ncbi:MAG TPA: hypothetical protein VOA64_11145 [Candidatus Dormibacteraeota bacterium]|nr:hypothetical protein [Candidatus Dormibacteraeota bacterium]